MTTLENAAARVQPSRPCAALRAVVRASVRPAIGALFLVWAAPTLVSPRAAELPNVIWIIGCVAFAAFALGRAQSKRESSGGEALAALAGMLLVPVLMRPAEPASGAALSAALALQIFGVALSQIAIVQQLRLSASARLDAAARPRGVFRLVRHPVYSGWLILGLGYAVSYPSLRNWALLAATVPFVCWRIREDEKVLTRDPGYREYRRHVPFVIVPGLI